MLSDGKKRQQCKRGRHRGHHQNLSERPLFLLFSDNMATAILSEKSRNLKKMSFLTLQEIIQYTYIVGKYKSSIGLVWFGYLSCHSKVCMN
jgi:hypothetical protein